MGKHHGKAHSKVWYAWQDMRKRCQKPALKDAALYKNRGISVCLKWESFISFYEDMGDPPTKQHQLDRINNNGNYCKENCRWVLPRENVLNRRTTRWFTYRGKTKCLTEWARSIGVVPSTLKRWIDNDKMDFQSAIQKGKNL